MKYLKRWNQLKESNESIESIESICKKYNIRNYTINSDGSIDVRGDVKINWQGFMLIQLPIQFGKVTGDFSCNSNYLDTLEGCPREVGGDFTCGDNNLTSLEGGPDIVGGHFNCYGNQLISLKGGPKKVGGMYDCRKNKLVSLVGAPEIVNFFICRSKITFDNPVQVITNFFELESSQQVPREFLEKINHIYTDLWMGDGWTIQGDVLEQIADDLGVILPEYWQDLVMDSGYTII